MGRGRRASAEIRLILGHCTAPTEITKQDPPRQASVLPAASWATVCLSSGQHRPAGSLKQLLELRKGRKGWEKGGSGGCATSAAVTPP